MIAKLRDRILARIDKFVFELTNGPEIDHQLIFKLIDYKLKIEMEN